MARRDYEGHAVQTTITAQVNPTDLSITLAASTGWPTGGANGEFFVTVNPDLTNEERILVASRSGNTLTIANTGKRGQDGTSAQTHASGSTIRHSYAAVEADEANFHVNDTTHDHHTQYMKSDGTRHDLTARHTFGAALGTPSAPTTIIPDAAASAGSGTVPSRSDHTHGIAAAVPVAIGTALAEGAGNDFARATHVHTIGAGAINLATMFGAGVVDAAAIATDAVGSDEIAANAVGASELANNAVDTAAIADAAVTLVKFASEAATDFSSSLTFDNVTGGTGFEKYAHYFKLGRIVLLFVGFRLGSGGDVTGQIAWNLPHTAADLTTTNIGNRGGIVAGRAVNSSGTVAYSGLGAIRDSDGKAAEIITAGTGDTWDADTPFNWGSSDVFQSWVFYVATT